MSLLNYIIEEGTYRGITGMIPEDFCIESVFADTYCNFKALERAMLMSDILAEKEYISEGTDPAVLVENIISSGWGKLKEMFAKLRDKIKEWYNVVKKQLQSIFMNQKDFIKKYKSELQGKSTSNFKYKGYPYKQDKGDSAVDAAFSVVETRIDNVIKFDVPDASWSANDITSSIAKKIDSSLAGEDGAIDQTELESKVAKAMVSGTDSMNEVVTELIKKYRGDENSKIEIEEFSEGPNVNDMIQFLEKSDKQISEATKNETKFVSTINKIISTFDSYGSKTGKTDAENKAYTYASKASSILSRLLSMGQLVCNVRITAYKEMASEYNSVLRSFIRKSDKSVMKNSYNIASNSESSLLSESLKMI